MVVVSLAPEASVVVAVSSLSVAVAEAEAEAILEESSDAALEAEALAPLRTLETSERRLEALLRSPLTLVLRVLMISAPSEVRVVTTAPASETTLEAAWEADLEAAAPAPSVTVVSPVVVTTSPSLLVWVLVKVETTADEPSLVVTPRVLVERAEVTVEPPEVMVLKTVEMVASTVLVLTAADF